MSGVRTPQEGRIAVGSDHAGFAYKQLIVKRLGERGVNYEDFGTTSEASVDYVDYAVKVSEAVASGEADFGILVCGSGIGMSIAANKVPGIRAAQCGDTYTAHVCREHNDANVLSLAERVIGIEVALEIVDVWLRTPFSGEERHVRRLGKITGLEEKYGEESRAEAKGCAV